MATLTTWEADRRGYCQGTATPGQLVGRWFLDKIGKLPKIPKLEPLKDHWSTWAEGKPIAIDDTWIDNMIRADRLPTRQQVAYVGNNEDNAEARVMNGTHVFVEMLDAFRKTRHRCVLHGTVLIASREGWEQASQRS